MREEEQNNFDLDFLRYLGYLGDDVKQAIRNKVWGKR